MKAKLIAFFLFISVVDTMIFSQSSFISKSITSIHYVYASNTIHPQTCIPEPIVEKPTGEGA